MAGPQPPAGPDNSPADPGDSPGSAQNTPAIPAPDTGVPAQQPAAQQPPTVPPAAAPPAASPPPLSRGNNPTDNAVQRTRAWTGLWVVIGGDAVIVLAAIWGVVKASGSTGSGSPIVAILTSAFTAIGTMTTAYFGIRSAANTAEHFKPVSTPAITPQASSGPPPPNS